MIGSETEMTGVTGDPQIAVGMKVRAGDGTLLGKVTEVLLDGFRVEKGLLFRHAHVVWFSDVDSVRDECVILRSEVRAMELPRRESQWTSMSRPGEAGVASLASPNTPGRGDADRDAYSSTRAELGETHPLFPAGLIDTGNGRFARPEDAPEGLPERVRIAEPEDVMIDVDGQERFFRPATETDELLVDTDGDGRYARPEDAGKVDGWRSQQSLIDTDDDGRFARPADAGKVDGVWSREGLVDTDGDGRFARPEDAGKVDGYRMVRSSDGLVDTDGDGRYARPEDAGKVDGRHAIRREQLVDTDDDGVFVRPEEAGRVHGVWNREGLVDTDGDGRFARPEDAGKIDGTRVTRQGEALVDSDHDGRFARPKDAGKVDGWRALDASAGAVTSLEGLRSEEGLVDTDGDGRYARPEDAGKVDGAKKAEERKSFFAHEDDDLKTRH